MATLKDFRDERLRKVVDLHELGVNPYPAKSTRTHELIEITDKFEELQGQVVSVVGRIKSIRKFGKIAFIVIRDESGEVQLFWREQDSVSVDRADSELLLDDIRLLDTGDFVECRGPIIKTQTGEISVEVQKLRILSKALRPMPSDQEGFTNKEERMRRRYVDMNVNKDVHDRFIRRSKFWQATRDYMNEKGFIEINIPVLEHTTGGADANPFVTHMDALDQDFYLRISHELPLKRLIGAGFEKVYDIGPRFRNENYSDEHLPEHVAMEWYWAYADWEKGMELMEDMFRTILQKTFGRLQFTLNGKEVDMSKPWERWDYAGVIRDHYGLEVFDCTIDQVKEKLKEHGLEVEKTENISRGIDKLWKKVRKDVAGPVWLINTPLFISPLSKADDNDPRFVQRFQAVLAGSELANGWSELNDPVDQLNRFVEQQGMREAGDDEAQMLDIDYVEMLEYGMPPACGLGFSERVFWVFEGVTAREGVPFPQLRQDIDEVTRSIYPEIKL
jgi:lysyl-tRNA synthetase class 2